MKLSRTFWAMPASLLLAVGWATVAQSEVILLEDDFESYADTDAMNAAWNDGATGAGTLDTELGNPGKSLAHPAGTTQKRAFEPTVPTDEFPLIWEFDMFDDGAGNKRITGGLRDNGAGAALNSLLEMGRNNSNVDPESGETVSGYAIRTVFIGGDPAGWVTFEGNPTVEEGWHNFKATIRGSDILFELDFQSDGTVDASRLVTITEGAIAYNVARFGGPSDLSSAGGGANFDNLSIRSTVPEPSGIALACLGLIGALAVARRR